MIYNKEFLKELDQQKHKVIYARITSLTFDEFPIEYIEGRVTQGSINIDGSSACRRSCSLTIAAPDYQYDTDYQWGLETKFKLEIGVENYIDTSYPEIIWFNQGIYIITSFNTAENTSTLNITIQGKDKMCLLDGSIGGSLESPVDFGTIEEENDVGIWTIRKIPIQDIIKNIVHIYGKEPYHNIIINDLDTYGLELLEYQYNIPLFLYRKIDNPVYENALLKGDNHTVYGYLSEADKNPMVCLLSELDDKYFELLTESFTNDKQSSYIIFKDDENRTPYCVAKINPGDTAGYRKTDLVYSGDLIANVGESITSVLDKIKTMLTEFEYFYNTNGQFVFQKKQSFKEAIWQFDEERECQNISETFVMADSDYAYKFYDKALITAFNNNPNLNQVKNDYSIWGERDSVSGVKIPIHLRYAIDKKPVQYTTIKVDVTDVDLLSYNQKHGTNILGQTPQTYSIDDFDWREIIYQMAVDYYRYNFLDDFEQKVKESNPIDYPTGRTGYEQYYIDLYSFWRELYYPDYKNLFDENNKIKYCSELERRVDVLTKEIYGIPPAYGSIYQNNVGGIENDLITLNNLLSKEETKELAQSKVNSWWSLSPPKYEFYYDEQKLTKITEPDEYLKVLNDFFFRKKEELENLTYQLEQTQLKYKDFNITDYYGIDEEHEYWNSKVYEAPEQLNFWFDFLDASGELEKFSVQAIGSRSKSINDTAIKSIYFRETPQVVYSENSNDYEPGFRFIQAPNSEQIFKISAQGKNAKDKLSELLYKHGYCVDSTTITTIPIYYLEPNTRIYIQDEKTGLQGDYIASKFTIPLTYNGTMSITATKAAENIL